MKRISLTLVTMTLSVLTRTVLLCLTVFTCDVLALIWDQADQATSEHILCAGEDLVVRQHYFLSEDEYETTRTWTFEYASKSSAKDFYSLVMDNTDTQTRQTVSREANITVVKPTAMHGGIYTLSVIVVNMRTGINSTYTRSIVVQITMAEAPAWNDPLQVSNRRERSPNGRQQITLFCGRFLSRGTPQVNAVWTTPSGRETESSGYEGGHFTLVLDYDAAEEGVYTCSIPFSSPVLVCLSPSDLERLNNANITITLNSFTGCEDPRITESGVYVVSVPNYGNVSVYCEFANQPGGWTVFQRRINGSVSFAQNWNEYQHGFGQPDGEFWLGLEPLHYMTSAATYNLRLDIEKFSGVKYWRVDFNFGVDSSQELYSLKIGNYACGNLTGAQFVSHNGAAFSTRDADHDGQADTDCANDVGGGGGWWYIAMPYCLLVNLNGHYYHNVKDALDTSGIVFFPMVFDKPGDSSLKATRMMFHSDVQIYGCDFGGDDYLMEHRHMR